VGAVEDLASDETGHGGPIRITMKEAPAGGWRDARLRQRRRPCGCWLGPCQPTGTAAGRRRLALEPAHGRRCSLRALGAVIQTTDGHAPASPATDPLPWHQPAVASAQVIGCLSLAALAAQGTTSIKVPAPTRDHTERMLAWLGAPVRREGLVTTIEGPAGYAARSRTVPGDISSAAAWLVAGAQHPEAEICLDGVGPAVAHRHHRRAA
jgi:3-phosphoshikimate 1-carboxyvinyltransferase